MPPPFLLVPWYLHTCGCIRRKGEPEFNTEHVPAWGRRPWTQTHLAGQEPRMPPDRGLLDGAGMSWEGLAWAGLKGTRLSQARSRYRRGADGGLSHVAAPCARPGTSPALRPDGTAGGPGCTRFCPCLDEDIKS